MRYFITRLFLLSSLILILLSLIVGIAWLFDSSPLNLTKALRFMGSITVCLLGLQILFEVKITFK